MPKHWKQQHKNNAVKSVDKLLHSFSNTHVFCGHFSNGFVDCMYNCMYSDTMILNTLKSTKILYFVSKTSTFSHW